LTLYLIAVKIFYLTLLKIVLGDFFNTKRCSTIWKQRFVQSMQ